MKSIIITTIPIILLLTHNSSARPDNFDNQFKDTDLLINNNDQENLDEGIYDNYDENYNSENDILIENDQADEYSDDKIGEEIFGQNQTSGETPGINVNDDANSGENLDLSLEDKTSEPSEPEITIEDQTDAQTTDSSLDYSYDDPTNTILETQPNGPSKLMCFKGESVILNKDIAIFTKIYNKFYNQELERYSEIINFEREKDDRRMVFNKIPKKIGYRTSFDGDRAFMRFGGKRGRLFRDKVGLDDDDFGRMTIKNCGFDDQGVYGWGWFYIYYVYASFWSMNGNKSSSIDFL